MFAEFGPGTLSDFIDVQGISHGNADSFANARKKQPTKPLIASECCSCLSQRDENEEIDGKQYRAFNADCLQAEVGLTDRLPVRTKSVNADCCSTLPWCNTPPC
jgi:hypothetical protein